MLVRQKAQAPRGARGSLVTHAVGLRASLDESLRADSDAAFARSSDTVAWLAANALAWLLDLIWSPKWSFDYRPQRPQDGSLHL